jgi:hypothetical protein
MQGASELMSAHTQLLAYCYCCAVNGLRLQVFALATVCERLPSGGSVAWQAPTLTYLVHKALGDTWNKVCIQYNAYSFMSV